MSSTNLKERKKMKSKMYYALENYLTDKQRKIITMYYIEGKNMIEISQVLGVNKSYVSRCIKTSIEKMKKKIA